jgi:hypothetical protein
MSLYTSRARIRRTGAAVRLCWIEVLKVQLDRYPGGKFPLSGKVAKKDNTRI